MLRDEIDRNILASLGENARMSFHELGGRVGLSAPAAKRRVDRLVSEGVIRGFTVVLDDEASGLGTEAFVELYCRSRTNPADIRAMLAGLPGIVDAYTVTGEADALLHIKTSNPAELEAIVERVRAQPNAERTKTVIVLSRLVPD